MNHLDQFIHTVKNAGITLNLKKCKWAQNRVSFCGQILGSGQRLADPEKVKVIHEMKTPRQKPN